MPLIKSGEMTLAVRPEDRRPPHPKAPRVGEHAKIRIIATPGDEEIGRQPLFGDFERVCRVDAMNVARICDLKPNDLTGASPDARYSYLIPFHLGLIYNRPFVNTETVTLVSFSYVT
jgi:hypothetical protein